MTTMEVSTVERPAYPPFLAWASSPAASGRPPPPDLSAISHSSDNDTNPDGRLSLDAEYVLENTPEYTMEDADEYDADTEADTDVSACALALLEYARSARPVRLADVQYWLAHLDESLRPEDGRNYESDGSSHQWEYNRVRVDGKSSVLLWEGPDGPPLWKPGSEAYRQQQESALRSDGIIARSKIITGSSQKSFVAPDAAAMGLHGSVYRRNGSPIDLNDSASVTPDDSMNHDVFPRIGNASRVCYEEIVSPSLRNHISPRSSDVINDSRSLCKNGPEAYDSPSTESVGVWPPLTADLPGGRLANWPPQSDCEPRGDIAMIRWLAETVRLDHSYLGNNPQRSSAEQFHGYFESAPVSASYARSSEFATQRSPRSRGGRRPRGSSGIRGLARSGGASDRSAMEFEHGSTWIDAVGYGSKETIPPLSRVGRGRGRGGKSQPSESRKVAELLAGIDRQEGTIWGEVGVARRGRGIKRGRGGCHDSGMAAVEDKRFRRVRGRGSRGAMGAAMRGGSRLEGAAQVVRRGTRGRGVGSRGRGRDTIRNMGYSSDRPLDGAVGFRIGFDRADLRNVEEPNDGESAAGLLWDGRGFRGGGGVLGFENGQFLRHGGQFSADSREMVRDIRGGGLISEAFGVAQSEWRNGCHAGYENTSESVEFARAINLAPRMNLAVAAANMNLSVAGEQATWMPFASSDQGVDGLVSVFPIGAMASAATVDAMACAASVVTNVVTDLTGSAFAGTGVPSSKLLDGTFAQSIGHYTVSSDDKSTRVETERRFSPDESSCDSDAFSSSDVVGGHLETASYERRQLGEEFACDANQAREKVAFVSNFEAEFDRFRRGFRSDETEDGGAGGRLENLATNAAAAYGGGNVGDSEENRDSGRFESELIISECSYSDVSEAEQL